MDLFSERLKELRKLSKMTQKEVGERIGMTAQGYAAFERGREPSFEKLKQLSELFAVSSDYLIGLSDSWNPSDQSTLSDYGFSDKTLEDLRRLKEKKDSFTTNDTLQDKNGRRPGIPRLLAEPRRRTAHGEKARPERRSRMRELLSGM